ncbi:hypothetical protein [Geoalkalibacter halelectricus]|uniref:CCA tRNA nucleotidyltransferase n=1 Tax=Geoalkalibacter halelectricus TaxID=2847045 RepID=A0ABY5ZMT5_9BACT|nr:hypothetical protein [Geoalkalibacter halelectricus]MDO3380067.1 hypothetical protein [Geoalkalibacter halelectricus]UWZ80413.1 hypothetical protein L9S41_03165 [Geoalkalibacter halelectricus]
MINLKRFLENNPNLKKFQGFLPEGQPCYLVGGAVRDILLEREIHDFDFALPEDPTALAQAWARHSRGHWFWLDEARRQSRVVLGRGSQEPTFDFSPFRAPDLEGDLRGRDFTLNALAIDMQRAAAPVLIDPLNGARDLAEGRLRACSPTSFRDDPLRVLRAARFAAAFHLHPDEQTLALAREAAPRLAQIAGERIKAELFALFSVDDPRVGLEVLVQSGGGENLFGPDSPASLHQTLELTSEFCRSLSTLPESRAWLAAEVEAGLNRSALLRLGVLLRSLATPVDFPQLRERLALARMTSRRLEALLAFNPETLAPPPDAPQSQRRLALWAERLGPDPADALLFLACQKGADQYPPALLFQALHAWQALNKQGRIAPLVGGDWIRRELQIADGLKIGRLLDLLAEAECQGLVDAPETAQKFLKSLAEKGD